MHIGTTLGALEGDDGALLHGRLRKQLRELLVARRRPARAARHGRKDAGARGGDVDRFAAKPRGARDCED